LFARRLRLLHLRSYLAELPGIRSLVNQFDRQPLLGRSR
jgi:hypothetical protein